MPPSGLEHSDDLLTKLDHAIQRVLDVSGIRYDDPNHPSSPVVVVGWNNWQWTQLPDDAAPLVGAARDALRRVREFASNAARHAPDRAAELRRLETRLERLIDQPNGTLPCGAPESTIEAVRARTRSDIQEFRDTFRRLPTAHGDGERLLVADTSRLAPDTHGSWF